MLRVLCLTFSLALVSCAAPVKEQKELPKPLTMAKPNYPAYAFINHIEGQVVFDFDIDAAGKVSEMRIIKSEPQHLFDDSVINAVSKWRYETGKPTKNMRMTVKMTINRPH